MAHKKEKSTGWLASSEAWFYNLICHQESIYFLLCRAFLGVCITLILAPLMIPGCCQHLPLTGNKTSAFLAKVLRVIVSKYLRANAHLDSIAESKGMKYTDSQIFLSYIRVISPLKASEVKFSGDIWIPKEKLVLLGRRWEF